MSLGFLRGQARFMAEAGFEVHVVTAPGEGQAEFAAREGATVHSAELRRSVAPVADLVALWQLWRLMRKLRPAIVHSHTPKGGMLGMLAATLSGVPQRFFHLRGLAYESRQGLGRRVLLASDWLSCTLAQRVFAVSESIRRQAVADGLCRADKIEVLAGGSGNGVDATGRFTPADEDARAQARQALGLPREGLVVGFVGRLAVDKGLGELVGAWELLQPAHPSAHLLIVGEQDERDGLSQELLAKLKALPAVTCAGHLPRPELAYAAMDLVALPTYREGFPNVALEAAAMALPLVATEVSGCVDAVLPEQTGLLVPPRDAQALARGLERYLTSAELRLAHGRAARERVLAWFRQEVIWRELLARYERRAAPRPRAGE